MNPSPPRRRKPAAAALRSEPVGGTPVADALRGNTARVLTTAVASPGVDAVLVRVRTCALVAGAPREARMVTLNLTTAAAPGLTTG
jgi:hypothetical protein